MLKKKIKLILCAAFMTAFVMVGVQSVSATTYSSIVIENSNSVVFTAGLYQELVQDCLSGTVQNAVRCIERAGLLITKMNELPFQIDKIRVGVGPRPVADSDFLKNANLFKISPLAINFTTSQGGFSKLLDSNQARIKEVTLQLQEDINNLKQGKNPVHLVRNPKSSSVDCVPLLLGININGLTGVRKDLIPQMNASMSRCF
jgi:hypothetical protein